MIGQFIDTMMLASTGIEHLVVMTHQTLSLEKYWKLFPATLYYFLILSASKVNLYFCQTSTNPTQSGAKYFCSFLKTYGIFYTNLQYERSKPFGDFAAHNLMVLQVLFP